MVNFFVKNIRIAIMLVAIENSNTINIVDKEIMRVIVSNNVNSKGRVYNVEELVDEVVVSEEQNFN